MKNDLLNIRRKFIKERYDIAKEFFWERYVSQNDDTTASDILEELKDREPIFHYPEKFGRSRQEVEAQMCDQFREVGASGNVYTKEVVIEILLERYNDPNYQDILETSNFELIPIALDIYLLRYNLVQNKIRKTRRSTIWCKQDGCWKILYHQGTIIGVDAV